MAGLRNTEAGNIDTTIGTLITQFTAYADVAVTGEPGNAAADYFIRSLLSRLAAGDSRLEYTLIQRMGLAHSHFKPVSLNEAASPTLVLIDPNAVA